MREPPGGTQKCTGKVRGSEESFAQSVIDAGLIDQALKKDRALPLIPQRARNEWGTERTGSAERSAFGAQRFSHGGNASTQRRHGCFETGLFTVAKQHGVSAYSHAAARTGNGARIVGVHVHGCRTGLCRAWAQSRAEFKSSGL
jgi:hypothetical protein